MPETQAAFYRDGAGREPVDDFIEALPAAAQVAIDNKIDLLNGRPPHAPPLPFPHSSEVRGGSRPRAIGHDAPSKRHRTMA